MRRLSAILAAAGSLVVLVLGMAMMDARVRDEVSHVIAGQGPSPQMLASASHVHGVLIVALSVARDQSLSNAPLTIFALSATVLLLVMLRI